jgi:catechol 2,3-dioxygenase-like lactoylglutathione lyase family enzyme
MEGMLMVFFPCFALFVSSVEQLQKRRNFMISGAHMIVYSKDAEADRAFFREVLGFASVDAGHGWLIFAMPPAEAAFHPSDANDVHELYFMCEDLKAEMAALAEKGVRCSDVQEARWGSITKIQLPGGGKVGLYQAKHPTAIGINL